MVIEPKKASHTQVRNSFNNLNLTSFKTEGYINKVLILLIVSIYMNVFGFIRLKLEFCNFYQTHLKQKVYKKMQLKKVQIGYQNDWEDLLDHKLSYWRGRKVVFCELVLDKPLSILFKVQTTWELLLEFFSLEKPIKSSDILTPLKPLIYHEGVSFKVAAIFYHQLPSDLRIKALNRAIEQKDWLLFKALFHRSSYLEKKEEEILEALLKKKGFLCFSLFLKSLEHMSSNSFRNTLDRMVRKILQKNKSISKETAKKLIYLIEAEIQWSKQKKNQYKEVLEVSLLKRTHQTKQKILKDILELFYDCLVLKNHKKERMEMAFDICNKYFRASSIQPALM